MSLKRASCTARKQGSAPIILSQEPTEKAFNDQSWNNLSNEIKKYCLSFPLLSFPDYGQPENRGDVPFSSCICRFVRKNNCSYITPIILDPLLCVRHCRSSLPAISCFIFMTTLWHCCHYPSYFTGEDLRHREVSNLLSITQGSAQAT